VINSKLGYITKSNEGVRLEEYDLLIIFINRNQWEESWYRLQITYQTE